MNDRIVALVDMDCFYCQVEARLNPDLEGKPMAVVQYNAWKGGGIIAVNYEARDRGVTRHMRGKEAKQRCPEIKLISVPSVRGKADLTKYRDAGREVVAVLCKFSECVQRASVDEAYIDLTDAVKKRLDNDQDIQAHQLKNTFVVGYSCTDSNDEEGRFNGIETWLDEVYNGDLTDPQLHRLATAASLVEEMRLAVYETTGFRCSAGIAHNKILAKLVCGLHKPNRQTVLPKSSVPELYQTLPVKKVRNLGGKLGDDVVERLGISVMADLGKFSERDLQARYDEKTGTWLYNIARGIDLEPVTPRLVTKSIGCCKKFPGRSALSTKKDVNHWLGELAAEVAERLEEDFYMNKRRAQLLTLSFQQDISGRSVALTRSGPFSGYEPDKIVAVALSLLQKSNTGHSSSELWTPPIKYLGISAGKFTETGGSSNSVSNFFKPSTDTTSNTSNERDKDVPQTSAVEKYTPKTNNTAENESQMKNTSGSFFEKYLRNKSKKLPENEITKRNCVYFEQTVEKGENDGCQNSPILSKNDEIEKQHENYKTDVFIRDINKNVDLFSQGRVETKERSDKCVESVCEKATTSYSYTNDSSNENKMNCSPLFPESNENADTWVSPSEIFPDMDNIDQSVLQLLPSPMQRKISSARINKTNENSNDSNEEKSIECHNGHSNNNPQTENRFSIMSSTSSECAPTILETVACVHDREQDYTRNNVNLKLNFGKHESNPTTSVDTSSIDIFAEENEQTETNVCEECPHCKEEISLQDFPEHLDHHIAMDLHKELNSVQPKENTDNRTAVSNKKKRSRTNKKEAPIPHKKTRTITSFFTRR